MIQIRNEDNEEFAIRNQYKLQFDLAYCDMIYDDPNFRIPFHFFTKLVKPGGIFIVQTDWHSVSEVDYYLKSGMNMRLLNNIVWKNEWGNHPKDRFHQCYDNILIYVKNQDFKEVPHKFFPEKIQVPKKTLSKGLNPSGRETKTATAWIDDICLTTTANERVKKEDGHLLRWQKPKALYDRFISPFLEEGDSIFDPYGGSFSLGVWAYQNKMSYLGLELDPEVYKLGKKNLLENCEGLVLE